MPKAESAAVAAACYYSSSCAFSRLSERSYPRRKLSNEIHTYTEMYTDDAICASRFRIFVEFRCGESRDARAPK